MDLQHEINQKYGELEDLIVFCEDQIRGNPIEGDEFLSSKIDMFNNTIYELGQLFEGGIIPMTRNCDAVQLDSL